MKMKLVVTDPGLMIYIAVEKQHQDLPGPEKNVVKVGHTTNLPKRKRRFAKFATNLREVEIIETFPGDQYMEATIHDELEDHCLRSEWYLLDDDTLDMIRSKDWRENLEIKDSQVSERRRRSIDETLNGGERAAMCSQAGQKETCKQCLRKIEERSLDPNWLTDAIIDSVSVGKDAVYNNLLLDDRNSRIRAIKKLDDPDIDHLSEKWDLTRRTLRKYRRTDEIEWRKSPEIIEVPDDKKE